MLLLGQKRRSYSRANKTDEHNSIKMLLLCISNAPQKILLEICRHARGAAPVLTAVVVSLPLAKRGPAAASGGE
jgi:hypothetical protein